MLNLQKYYDDDPFLKVSGYRENVSFEMDYQNEHETITHYSSDAEGKAEKILICRDSFGVHMLSTLQELPGRDADGLPDRGLRGSRP